MALRIISLARCIVIALALHSTSATAQDYSIQRALFEDCDRAQRAFAELDVDKRAALVDYLTRVVGLNTQAPAAPEAFALLPNGKPFEPLPAPLWQTTDAKRELRAKRCALELLTMSGALAFNSLVSLTSLYSQQALSDEIAVGIEEATATIAEQAHKSGINLTDEDLPKLVPFLTSEHPLVAQNLLHEYLALSLPKVLIFLSSASETDAARIVTFLRDADPDGGRAMRAFLDLVDKLPHDDADRLAGYLPFPSKNAAAPLVADFARLAAQTNRGPSVYSLLGKACLLFRGILIDPSLSGAVALNTGLLRENALPGEEQQCLISSIPALANNVAGLVLSSQDSETRQGLALIPFATSAISQDKSGTLYNRIKDLSLQHKGQHRQGALLSLGYFTNRKSDVITLLLQVLTIIISSSDARDSTPFIDAALQSALKVSSDKELSKLAAPTWDALKRGIRTPALIDVASRIDSLESGLVSLATSPRTETASLAIASLKKRSSLNKKSIPNIVEALRQPTVAADAEELLIPQGATTIPLLRRALLRSSSSQRLGVLSLLQALGGATRSERFELASTLSIADHCETVNSRSRTIESLLIAPDLEQDLKNKLRSKVLSCLCLSEESAAESLLKSSAPALFADTSSVDLALQDTKSCPRIEMRILEQVTSASLSDAVRSHIATKITESGPREAKVALLDSLTRDYPLAQQVLPTVRALAATAKDDKDLAFRSVLALARLGDSQFEWISFVRDTIDSSDSGPNYNVALEIIRALPADLVLAEVGTALDSDNPQRVAGACRVGATLGPLAIPVVSKVWNLRERRSPTIRYAATLALLEINPLTPELHQALKAILVNRYYAVALKRPIQWRQCLAVADLDKTSFGTLRSVHLERLALK